MLPAALGKYSTRSAMRGCGAQPTSVPHDRDAKRLS